MFGDIRTTVLVGQVALGTSLETHFGCMLKDRTGGGNGIADLLDEAIGLMDPREYHAVWSPTPLWYLPSELVNHARALDPTADPVALEREARSALTRALPHIMETYEGLADHSVPASMQRGLIDAILAELEEGAEPVPARLTGLCRPRAMMASTNAEMGAANRAFSWLGGAEGAEAARAAAEKEKAEYAAAAANRTAALKTAAAPHALRRPRTAVSITPRVEENEKKREEKAKAAEEAKKREEKARAAEEKEKARRGAQEEAHGEGHQGS